MKNLKYLDPNINLFIIITKLIVLDKILKNYYISDIENI